MAYCPHCEERYYEECCPVCGHPLDCGCEDEDDSEDEDGDDF